LSFANADSVIINSDHAAQDVTSQYISQGDQSSINLHQNKHFQVGLSEKVVITENKPQQQIPNDQAQVSYNRIIAASFSERIALTENNSGHDIVVLVGYNSQMQTIMDKINPERIRFNGRSIVINDPWDQQSPTKLYLDEKQTPQDNLVNDLATILNIAVAKPIENIFTTQDIIIFATIDSIKHDLIQPFDFTNTKNPTLIVLLVPLAGYLLIRAEGARFQFFKSKQTLSFCFIVILVASVVVTPLSVSGYGTAYAESVSNSTSVKSNSTVTNSTVTNSTKSASISFSEMVNILDEITKNLSLIHTNSTKLTKSASISDLINMLDNVSVYQNSITHLNPTLVHTNSTKSVSTSVITIHSTIVNSTKSASISDLINISYTI
jgi:hypothetical protein